jgi:hypothetical protein
MRSERAGMTWTGRRASGTPAAAHIPSSRWRTTCSASSAAYSRTGPGSTTGNRRRQRVPADDETARVIAKSPAASVTCGRGRPLSDQREAQATRAVATEALVDAFVRFGGDVREQAAKALLVVDDASTPSLIAIARKNASGKPAADLERLDCPSSRRTRRPECRRSAS